MSVCICATVFRLRNGIPGTARLIRTTPQRKSVRVVISSRERVANQNLKNSKNSVFFTRVGEERKTSNAVVSDEAKNIFRVPDAWRVQICHHFHPTRVRSLSFFNKCENMLKTKGISVRFWPFLWCNRVCAIGNSQTLPRALASATVGVSAKGQGPRALTCSLQWRRPKDARSFT